MVEQLHNYMHRSVTLLWLDLLWIFFTALLVILASVFYFLNRQAAVNRAFALLLLIIAYFAVISILVISFQAIGAHWSILLMPVLCYLGFVFYLFVKAVLGASTLIEKRERLYFLTGLIFSAYTLYKLIHPASSAELRQTSSVVEHTLLRAYTREPMYALYVVYILLPVFLGAARLWQVVRAPTAEQREIQGLARSILWIFSLSVTLALAALSVAPILGFRQAPLLGSIALMASVLGYAWTLVLHRGPRAKTSC